MKRIFESMYEFFTNRLLIMFAIFGGMFYLLCTALFNIQIVNGQDYQPSAKRTYQYTVNAYAPRGEIFDRNGRPLAINHTTVMVKIDTAIKVAEHNAMLLDFIRMMEQNGETLIDNFPVSSEEPREFLFNNSKAREERWKKDMGVPLEATADEAVAFLIDFFSIPTEDLSPHEIRMLLVLREAVYMQRFDPKHITVALDISERTRAALEEQNQDFPGIYIDVDYTREYPEGEYISHIIGYIRKINATQLAKYEPYGYTADDIVGHDGIESAFELQLRGETGQTVYEMDQSTGRRVGVVSSTEAVSGNNIFLTIDIELQKSAFHILENQLKEILLAKLNSTRASDYVSTKTLLSSMIGANNISINAIMFSDEESLSYPIKKYVQEKSGLNFFDSNYQADLKSFIQSSVETGKITENQMILAMYEQGIVSVSEDELARLQRGTLQSLGFLCRAIEKNEITPQMTNIHPCTGSIVVTDVKTGGVLAAVSYPTYDNNQFVNNFNSAYYYKLLDDPTFPMNNRPFTEARAFGSTFKMITAIAGLETGAITLQTKIRDEGIFTKAGQPYARCAGGAAVHGSVDVVSALEVSCNYFFYETAFRMGNTRDNTKIAGIKKLNDYMIAFGLGLQTGVEIYEHQDTQFNTLPSGLLAIPSPEYKEYLRTRSSTINTTLANSLWNDGDTIRTAIGQESNNSTPASLAKYIATLASGGIRYRLHLMDKITAYDGKLITEFVPEVEHIVDVSPENMAAVHKGMLAVTSGSKGTATRWFRDFPIKVAGKTGTAQEARFPADHTAFGCFAPYDDPQVAVYVQISGSAQSTISAPSAKAARLVLEEYFALNSEPEYADPVNTLVK